MMPPTALQIAARCEKDEVFRQRFDKYGLADTPELEPDVQALLDKYVESNGEDAGNRGLYVRGVDLALVRPTRWLWNQRLPLGYLALLLGAEGVGKGTFEAWLMARVTRGELPGDRYGKPGRVLVVGDEDSFDTVVVPRAFAAGADLSRVDLLDEAGETLDLRRNSEEFAAILREADYPLVLLDNLLDALGVDIDDWRAKPVRDSLRPLRRVVRELEITALASLHPNKGGRQSFRDLVSGSFAFNSSSRSSLMLAQHPDDEHRRVLVRGKGNLSIAPPSFEFTLEGREPEINGHTFSVPVVADEQDGTMTIDDLIKPDRSAPVRESLADKIDALGSGGIQSRADIAKALGRSNDDRSVGRALDQLEAEDRWEKVGRGKWRKLGIGIGTSKDAPMSNVAVEGSDAENAEAERLLEKFGGDAA